MVIYGIIYINWLYPLVVGRSQCVRYSEVLLYKEKFNKRYTVHGAIIL